MDHQQMADLIEPVLSDYLDQVDPEDVDTDVLADNIARVLQQAQR